MKTFKIQYPANTQYVSQSSEENLLGVKSNTLHYKTPDGTFSIQRSPSSYSSVQMREKSSQFVTQIVRDGVNDDVFSSKVTVVGKGDHHCKSVQTLLKDGTYKVERFINDIEVGGYEVKPLNRKFTGLKGFLEKTILWFSTDINGCENVKIAPLVNRLLMKIRHF